MYNIQIAIECYDEYTCGDPEALSGTVGFDILVGVRKHSVVQCVNACFNTVVFIPLFIHGRLFWWKQLIMMTAKEGLLSLI